MDARYSYDESAEVWPYFVLTLVGLYVVPATVLHLRTLVQASRKPSLTPKIRPDARAARHRSRAVRSRRGLLVVVGWVIIAAIVGIIVRQQPSEDPSASFFDPWNVLGVASSASEREVKSAYRKLSLQFHPDKVKETAEWTKEFIEERYVQITKAYQALTDEATRENFRLYGHPDGPQPVSHGIALPSFLVGSTGSVVVVAFYVVVVGLLLPVFVGQWWSKQQEKTRGGLLQSTASQFTDLIVKQQPHFLFARRILDAVLKSADMTAQVSHLSLKERHEKLRAYLERDNPDHEALEIAAETARLLLQFLEICAQFKSPVLIERIVELHRQVVQAVPADLARHGEYLQLPDADMDAVRNQQQPGKIDIALQAGRKYIPRLHILKAEFKVNGESKVPTNAETYLQIKVVVLPLGAPTPKIDAAILNSDVGTNLPDPSSHNKTEPPLPDAHAPWFPDDIPTRWVACLMGERDAKLLVGPIEVTNLNLQNLSLTNEQIASGDDVVISTLNFRLPTPSPPFPGAFAFRFEMMSTTYFGCDIHSRVVMQVVTPPPVTEVTEIEEDEIPTAAEEETDSEDDLSDIDTDTEVEDDDAEEDVSEKKQN